MQKSLLGFIFDYLFTSLLIFFISFIWLRLFIHNNILIYVYTSLITLILGGILFFIYKKKIYKIKLTKKEQKTKQKLLNGLIFASSSQILNLISKFFIDYEIKTHREFLEVRKEEKFLVFHFFSLQSLNCNNLVDFIKTAQKQKINKIMIFCTGFDKDLNKFIKNLKNFKVKLIDFDNFYVNYIKNKEISIDFEERYEEKYRFNFKELLNIAFNKKKTKTYILTGFIFLIGAIFLRYNIYYIVFTTIMFTFAMFSFFNKVYNKKENDF